MADIHLHTPGGDTVVRPEEQVVELLRSGELAAPVLFWRSGMADWEPVANLAAAHGLPATHVLPDTQRLSVSSLAGEAAAEQAVQAPSVAGSASKPMPELKPRPAAEPATRRVAATGRRRFNFRRDPEPLTTILQVMLVLCLCLAALELANAVVRYTSLATAMPPLLDANGNPMPAAADTGIDQVSSVSADGSALLTPDSETGNDDIGQLLQWTGWGANGLLMVFYFMWLYRTDQNCRNFSSIMRFSPEWAVWCYFVPPLCFFRPVQVMQEIWRVSRNPRTWNNDRQSFFVALWWLLTVGTIGIAIYVAIQARNASDHAAQVNNELVFLGLKVVQVAWYGVFLTLVTSIVHKQLRLVRESRRHSRDDDEDDE